MYYDSAAHSVAAGVVLPLLAITAVSLRFWVRSKQKQEIKQDDWLLIPATLLTVGIGIIMCYGVSRKVLGYDVEFPEGYAGSPFEIQTDQLELNGKLEWAFNIMFPLVIGCTKASLLFFYLRIFSISRGTRFTLIGMIIFIAAWAVAFFFANVFSCNTNFQAIWGPTANLYTFCTKTTEAILTLCFTDFFTDLVVILVPIPLIWRLNLTRAKKLAVSGIFLLGIVTIAASLTRLIITARVVIEGFFPTADEIRIVTLYIYWAMIESGIGIVVACLPSLSLLLKPLSWQAIVTTTRGLLRTSRWGSSQSQGDTSNITLQRLESGEGNDVKTELPRFLREAVSHDPIKSGRQAARDE